MKRILGHELFRRSALFSLSIIASTLVGVFSIPVLVSTIGATQWGVLAVMQAVGQILAVVVAFGWGATGPSMVSARPQTERKAMFAVSLRFRGVLFVLAAPVTVALCVTLTGTSVVNAALATVSYVLVGLSAAWYLVGTNRPLPLFVFDALPAVVGQVAGLIAVLMWGDMTAYLACTAAFTVIGIASSAIFVLTRSADGRARADEPSPWRSIVHEQAAGVSSTISASLWTGAPTVLVQLFAPAAVPVFAMIDRLLKYGVLALAPILQAVQGWVPESGRERTADRAITSIRISVVIGALGGLALALLSTPASELLTVGEAPVPWTLAAIAGFALLSECVSQVTGLSALVALGGSRYLAVSSIASAVLGIPIIAVLVVWLGLYGAVIGILVVATGLAVYRVHHALRLAAAARQADQGRDDGDD